MKVAIYARVSTIDQHPENQINALREYIAHHTDDKGSHDWEIYDEYIDYITGSNSFKSAYGRCTKAFIQDCGDMEG